jgi:hypothetical protein
MSISISRISSAAGLSMLMMPSYWDFQPGGHHCQHAPNWSKAASRFSGLQRFNLRKNSASIFEKIDKWRRRRKFSQPPLEI